MSDDGLDCRAALIDWNRAACLCEVGAPGFVVAVTVTQTGDDVPWLVATAELDAEHPRAGNSNQPHEQLGPLPPTYTQRIRRTMLRCGRPRKDGCPCRTPVAHAGDTCTWHREATTP